MLQWPCLRPSITDPTDFQHLEVFYGLFQISSSAAYFPLDCVATPPHKDMISKTPPSFNSIVHLLSSQARGQVLSLVHVAAFVNWDTG